MPLQVVSHEKSATKKIGDTITVATPNTPAMALAALVDPLMIDLLESAKSA